MPLKKIKVQYVVGARGTMAANELLEQAREEWEQIREQYQSYNEDEQNELIEYFNEIIKGNPLGDALFGIDATNSDFTDAVTGLEDE